MEDNGDLIARYSGCQLSLPFLEQSHVFFVLFYKGEFPCLYSLEICYGLDTNILGNVIRLLFSVREAGAVDRNLKSS